MVMVLLGLSLAGAAPHTLEDTNCVHCHADPHPVPEQSCVACHTLEAWAPSTFTLEDHAKTSFPIEGKHEAVACSACHISAALTGVPTECAGCHVDRHRGKLGQQCTDCHSVSGFKPVADFVHVDRTGFALEGHHNGVACEKCHEGTNGAALRMTLAPTCATCHGQGHGPIGSQCSDCHAQDHTSFAQAAKGFDHRPTSFRLERRHRNVSCASCHQVGQTRPPDPSCRSCHTDVHAGQLGTVCSDCHRPDRWTVVRWDHDLTGWPLSGRHFVAPCQSCHLGQNFVGLNTECFSCHQPDLVRAPQNIPAHSVPTATCDDCHNTWSWRF